VIDPQGYRLNVGIILCNHQDKVLWARRIGQEAWQFPQGGIREQEQAEQALIRELWEEIGLDPHHVEILGSTQGWLRYKLPKRLIRHGKTPLCIGQKQRWFVLRFTGNDQDIDLSRSDKPEFDHWRWVDYWHPLAEVVSFKREVYEQALAELEPFLKQTKNQTSGI